MYDLVKIIVPIDPEAKFNFDRETELSDSQSGEYIGTLGRLRNLKIVQKQYRLIITGSLAKYLLGNNLDMLSLKTTKEAIAKLSNELGVSFEKAFVTKLEFGANILLMRNIHLYLDCLLLKRGFTKRSYPTTVQFTQTIKALSLYDKIEEMKINKGNINILRYEIKLSRQIGKTLKWGKVRVSDLYNPIFYRILKNIWLNEYCKISKKKKLLIIKKGSISNLKNLKKTLCSLAVHLFGIQKIIQIINSLNVGVSKQMRSKLRKTVYDLSEDRNLFEDVYLIKELNKKIKEIAESDEL